MNEGRSFPSRGTLYALVFRSPACSLARSSSAVVVDKNWNMSKELGGEGDNSRRLAPLVTNCHFV